MGSHTTEATRIADASAIIVNVLKEQPKDVPFACIFLTESSRLNLIGIVGIEKGKKNFGGKIF